MLADALLAVRERGAELRMEKSDRRRKRAAVARRVDREKKDEEAVLGRRGRDLVRQYLADHVFVYHCN
jgi:hypothetical protein